VQADYERQKGVKYATAPVSDTLRVGRAINRQSGKTLFGQEEVCVHFRCICNRFVE